MENWELEIGISTKVLISNGMRRMINNNIIIAIETININNTRLEVIIDMVQ